MHVEVSMSNLATQLIKLDELMSQELLREKFLEDGVVKDRSLLDGEVKSVADLIDQLADQILIVQEGRLQGQPNFTAMQHLSQRYGYDVVKGEGDSFGWLTGVIVGKNYKLVYG